MAPYVSVPLSHNFNLTFATGKIPNDFKVALIAPVYISVLPFFSKILEKLMYERLIDYINQYVSMDFEVKVLKVLLIMQ